MTVACLDAQVERAEVAARDKAKDLASLLERRRMLLLSAPGK